MFQSTNMESTSLWLGRPSKSYCTYERDGIWQTSEAAGAGTYIQDTGKAITYTPGLIKVSDLNGDNIIDSANDRGYIGSQTPKWFMGLNNQFKWKNFDLSIYVYVRWGHWGDNPLANYNPATGGAYDTYSYWTENGGGNDFPMLNRNLQFHQYHGYEAYWYVDRSFFRVKNMSIGYTLPRNFVRSQGRGNMRIYATGNNLWSISKHRFLKNFDPEGLTRQFVFGVNFEF